MAKIQSTQDGWREVPKPDLGPVKVSALGRQVGGEHYLDCVIQPVEFITKNYMSFLQGSIIKRICRYKAEGGKGLEDLEKIKHEIDLIIELEGWNAGPAGQGERNGNG